MVPVCSLLAALVLTAGPYEEGTLLSYRGSLQPVKLDQPHPGKSFELTLLVGPAVDDTTRIDWLLSDSDARAIPWQERWGTLHWSHKENSIQGTVPSFEFEHTTDKTRVNIATPLPLFRDDLKAGDTWSEGKIEFEVSEGDRVNDRPTLDVMARTLIGRRRTMTLDRADRRVYSLRETVFVGQGEEHLLTYQLAESKLLEGDALNKAMAAIDAWTAVRNEWASATEDRTPQNLAAARKSVAAKLPELRKTSEGTPLAGLSDATAAQLKSDDEQKSAAGALRTRSIGKKLPQFDLKDVANTSWSNESLAGKVTVLHFWTYRDENLREPYGQVGYLDFLSRRTADEKVQVLGIAVAPTDPEKQPSQRAFVRKFRDFMNVSYPILLDDGTLLEKIGDPRKARQELPLFVVIDAKGKIVEYHPGLFEVRRDEGLTELEGIVKKASAPNE